MKVADQAGEGYNILAVFFVHVYRCPASASQIWVGVLSHQTDASVEQKHLMALQTILYVVVAPHHKIAGLREIKSTAKVIVSLLYHKLCSHVCNTYVAEMCPCRKGMMLINTGKCVFLWFTDALLIPFVFI